MKIRVRVIQVICLASLLIIDEMTVQLWEFYFFHLHLKKALGYDFNRVTRAFNPEQLSYVKYSAFLGFSLGRTCGGFLAMLLNNKYFLLVTASIDIIVNALFRFIVLRFHFIGFSCCILTIFMAQSFHFPLAMNILAKWLPPNEYTRTVVALKLGSSVAPLIFSTDFNWFGDVPLGHCLLVFNFLKIAWALIFLVVGAQDPQTSFLIQKPEWDVLSKEIGARKKVHCKLEVPWKSIFCTPALYGIMFPLIADRWFQTSTDATQAFFSSDISHDSFVAMLFIPFVQMAFAWCTDSLIEKRYVSCNDIRKFWCTVSFWGAAISLAWSCFCIEDSGVAIVFFTLARYFNAFSDLGLLAAFFDLTPNYAALLTSLTSLPSWATRAFAYLLNGKTMKYEDDTTSKAVKNLPILYRAAALCFVFNYPFLVCGKITLCKFDSYDAIDWRKVSYTSYP